MRIIVTGGAGYVGSIVTAKLVEQGARVVVYDNLQFGHREAVHPDALFVEGDLANTEKLETLFALHGFDAVMHFAANTLPGESMEKPFLYLRDNVTNALNLLQSAARYGARKIVLSSTANLFDRPEKIPISEDEKIAPGSPYGESKHLIERMLHWMDRTMGMRYACLRYFNAAGAMPGGDRGEDHKPEYHLIPIVMQVALGQRSHVEVFGADYPTPDGTCVRDYIHVLDLAQAHILALEALDSRSRVYNLGNGRGFSVLQVIETAREVTGHPIPALIGPRRPGDPAVLIASSDRIRRELGWKPRYPGLRDIIETAWSWHRTHPHGYETSQPGRDQRSAGRPTQRAANMRFPSWMTIAETAAKQGRDDRTGVGFGNQG
ncbi:MAG: UDP-glucose 4-epimerase GalE [Chloroflexi bacterium]|nr:UDP-glucose 4-epimerase GalE [Chloroflexota bacterium]